jgi:hypothetical protein
VCHGALIHPESKYIEEFAMVAPKNKRKIRKVIKGLTKASKTHARQAKTLKKAISGRGKA